MLRTLVVAATILLLSVQHAKAQATYTLMAAPKTVAWGYYDAKAAPVLRVKSGDTVERLYCHSERSEESAFWF